VGGDKLMCDLAQLIIKGERKLGRWVRQTTDQCTDVITDLQSSMTSSAWDACVISSNRLDLWLHTRSIKAASGSSNWPPNKNGIAR
jgi:hypothetical protein